MYTNALLNSIKGSSNDIQSRLIDLLLVRALYKVTQQTGFWKNPAISPITHRAIVAIITTKLPMLPRLSDFWVLSKVFPVGGFPPISSKSLVFSRTPFAALPVIEH